MSLFNDEQQRTLVAALDRIVPADGYPSASQLGCLDFLLRLIPLEHLEKTYCDGLDGLNAESLAKGSPFFDLPSTQQDELLHRLRHGHKTTDWKTNPKQFVAMLARQTIEGYYSDPGNGGNRGEVAWHMVGFEVKG